MMCRNDQSGSASLFVVSLIGVVVLLGLGAAFMTATAAAHRRAQAGADLAALAGASSLQQGGDPCAESTRVAAANEVAVTSCVVAGEDILVEVRTEGPEFLGHTFDITARSRAGPGSRSGPGSGAESGSWAETGG